MAPSQESALYMVSSAGATNIEDEADVLPSFDDEVVGPPVNENRLVEDG